MKLGNLITSKHAGLLPLYEAIHGIFVSEFYDDEIGIVIDSDHSTTDIPYVQIITSAGKRGWIRQDKVEVLQ